MKMGVQTYSFLACSPATPGEETAWTPPPHSAPIWCAPPEAKQTRVTFVSTRVRTSASCARSATRRSAPRKAPHGVALRTPAETVSLVVTQMAHGCPRQAIVVAFGDAERTVACWLARAGVQGPAVHEHLVEQPRDLGQVQADEIRVKKQGGMVWMALAMMISTR